MLHRELSSGNYSKAITKMLCVFVMILRFKYHIGSIPKGVCPIGGVFVTFFSLVPEATDFMVNPPKHSVSF